MNKIVFELHPDDRARLDRIATALESLALQQQTATDSALIDATGALTGHPADASITHLEPTVAAPTAPASEPAPVEPASEVKTISLGEFQKAIVTRCAESPVMKAKVQVLIKRYAESVSLVPEDKRSEVLAELANL